MFSFTCKLVGLLVGWMGHVCILYVCINIKAVCFCTNLLRTKLIGSNRMHRLVSICVDYTLSGRCISNTNIRCFHIYMTSKPATVDSCFGLVGPHQYGALDTGRVHMQKMISLWTSLQTCGRWFICSKLWACAWTGHNTNASKVYKKVYIQFTGHTYISSSVFYTQKKEIYFCSKAKIFSSFLLILMHVLHYAK